MVSCIMPLASGRCVSTLLLCLRRTALTSAMRCAYCAASESGSGVPSWVVGLVSQWAAAGAVVLPRRICGVLR